MTALLPLEEKLYLATISESGNTPEAATDHVDSLVHGYLREYQPSDGYRLVRHELVPQMSMAVGDTATIFCYTVAVISHEVPIMVPLPCGMDAPVPQ